MTASDIIMIIVTSIIFIGFIFGIVICLCGTAISYGYDDIGINHLSYVYCGGCGGDFSFEGLSDDELKDALIKEWRVFRNFSINEMTDETHLAEFRYIDFFGNVKTAGYITKDGACYKNKKYKFVEIGE